MNRKEFSPNNFRRYLERPDMKGEKDYNDYAKTLNEEMYEHKNRILKTSTPIVTETICSKTGSNFFNSRKKLRGARLSMTQADLTQNKSLKINVDNTCSHPTALTNSKVGGTPSACTANHKANGMQGKGDYFQNNPDEAEIKPRLLENRVINQKEFFNLSNGFQKVFANDYQDKAMALPIAGYSGHQRGDKAQNYYGRTFRDGAIQSKKLERQLHKVR